MFSVEGDLEAPRNTGFADGMSLQVNRAPVLTLWAAVVAGRLGHPYDTALTLGRAVAGSAARVMLLPPPGACYGIIGDGEVAVDLVDRPTTRSIARLRLRSEFRMYPRRR